MREQLSRAIKLAPEFAPAYYLLAFIDLVSGENLDEALQMAEKARRFDRGRASYALLLAEIHARRKDLAAARPLLEPLTRDSDPRIKNEAQSLLDSLDNPSARGNANVSTALAAAEPVAANTTLSLGGDSRRPGREHLRTAE